MLPPQQQKNLTTILQSGNPAKFRNLAKAKFHRKKDCKQVVSVMKELKDLNSTDLDFLEELGLFINDCLCPYYRAFWNNAKNYGTIKKFTVNYCEAPARWSL